MAVVDSVGVVEMDDSDWERFCELNSQRAAMVPIELVDGNVHVRNLMAQTHGADNDQHAGVGTPSFCHLNLTHCLKYHRNIEKKFGHRSI